VRHHRRTIGGPYAVLIASSSCAGAKLIVWADSRGRVVSRLTPLVLVRCHQREFATKERPYHYLRRSGEVAASRRWSRF